MKKLILIPILLTLFGCDSHKSQAKEDIEKEAKNEFSVDKVEVDLYKFNYIEASSAKTSWDGKAYIYYEKNGEKICKDAVVGFTGKFGALESVIDKYEDCKK